MKLCGLLIAITATVVVGLPVEEPKMESPRVYEFEDENGQAHTIDLDEQPDMDLLSEITRNPANNKYFLFTRRNPDVGHELVYRSPETIWNSPLEAWKHTVVVAHGYLNNQNSNINEVIRDAYLENHDVNVIVLDWRRLALSGYVTAVTGVPAVGQGLGQFLHWLQEQSGLQFNNVHLVGFSLGAHLVGNAGTYLGGQVARVTGLDPAGPLWNFNSNRLSSAAGKYVEAIHTDGALTGFGIGTEVAHADFFANGGNSQPGCLTSICDHNRAWDLFAATVKYNHLIGNECSTNLQLTLNRCSGKQLPMGNADLNKWGTGTYRVNTARRYPY